MMDNGSEETPAIIEDEMKKLQKEYLEAQTRVQTLQRELSTKETENEHLQRMLDRTNTENDQLLQKLDILSRNAHVHEENVDIMKSELDSLKEQNRTLRANLQEMNEARDKVVEKLKDVSIETRELIENCEKTSDESKLFREKSEALEDELKRLKDGYELLAAENQHLRGVAAALQKESLAVNDTLAVGLRTSNGNILELIQRANYFVEEYEKREQDIVSLKEENVEKDRVISKQSEDFRAIKATVDEYHAEIVRLDTELKDCHKRVTTLNKNLEVIDFENFDLVEYDKLKHSLRKFGGSGSGGEENVEKLLAKLQTLYEIEDFFENKLAAHVDLANRNCDSNEQNQEDDDCGGGGGGGGGTPEKDASNTIARIKNYLERTLYAFERLNEKTFRLRTDYEERLNSKNAEISTLLEVLSNATLYNKMLEQYLQQCSENSQLNRTVENKTGELITVNKTLLDNFEELMRIYRICERCTNTLFAKSKQLQFCFRLMKLFCGKWLTEKRKTSPPSDEMDGNEDCWPQRVNDLFALMEEIFAEISETEKVNIRKEECEKLLNDYEKTLVTKDYLKSTVENISTEVKRLTHKVEHELVEKIREIESLREEMNSLESNNQELMSKVKTWKHEIVFLTTENYELKEKLESVAEVRPTANAATYERISDKLRFTYVLCRQLKSENLRFKEETANMTRTLTETYDQFAKAIDAFAITRRNVDLNLTALQRECAEFCTENENLKRSFVAFKQRTNDEILSLAASFADLNASLDGKQRLLADSIANIRNNGNSIKQESQKLVALDCKQFIADVIIPAKVTLSEKLRDLSISFESAQNQLSSAIREKETGKQVIAFNGAALVQTLSKMKQLKDDLHSIAEEMVAEFCKYFQVQMIELQKVVSGMVDGVKTSFSLSNEEVIKEMQEMNLELKTRGETISKLCQTTDELKEEKKRFLELINEKDNRISDFQAKISSYEQKLKENVQIVENLRNEYETTRTVRDREHEEQNERLRNVTNDVERMKMDLQSKEETIAHLENEIAKHKESQDGDVSSMGTISRTEEINRLKDVEDSFEERYLKLRALAIKMKKEITELKQQLELEKSERTSLQNKMLTITEQAKRNQALQEECDRLTDELEIKANEIKELKKIILDTDKGNEQLKSQQTKLSSDLEKLAEETVTLKTDKKRLEKQVTDLTAKLENQDKENFAEELIKSERSNEIQLLKQKLRENENSTKKLSSELEQAQMELRKQSVLTLEMRDYEKTISDLNAKINEMRAKNDELNEKLKTCTEANVSLVEKIKQLEEQIASYVASNKMSDEQILSLNKMIMDHEKSLEEKERASKSLTQQLEKEKSNGESLSQQLGNVISELSSLKQQFKSEEKHFNEQLKSSQSKIGSLEEKLKKKENNFNKLKEDFEAYKIRAHNALQKGKLETNIKTNEEKLRAEMEILSQTVKELRTRLDNSCTELENHKTELKLAETTKEQLQIKSKEITRTLAERTKELDTVRMDYKAYKLNTETLVENYKVQTSQLKTKSVELSRELEELRTKYNSEVALNSSAMNHITRIEDYEDNPRNAFDNGRIQVKDQEIQCNLENGIRRKHPSQTIIPLDRLLETNIDETESVEENALRKHVKVLESQVEDLKRTVAESEKNAERTEEQVSLLKEEIRRFERTVEREPHLQNSEYIKNVLFKFVTLPFGDEKYQLVNVLVTILKLTSEEKQILSSIAKGYSPEPTKQGPGWTSFLGWS